MVWPGILEKAGKKLEKMKERKKNIRERWRWNKQHSRSLLWTVNPQDEKPWEGVVLWLGKTAKLSFIFLFFLFLLDLLHKERVWEISQISFGHISINSLTILMVLKVMESPQKDLSIDVSHILRQSILAKILSRSTSNHYVTIY